MNRRDFIKNSLGLLGGVGAMCAVAARLEKEKYAEMFADGFVQATTSIPNIKWMHLEDIHIIKKCECGLVQDMIFQPDAYYILNGVMKICERCGRWLTVCKEEYENNMSPLAQFEKAYREHNMT